MHAWFLQEFHNAQWKIPQFHYSNISRFHSVLNFFSVNSNQRQVSVVHCMHHNKTDHTFTLYTETQTNVTGSGPHTHTPTLMIYKAEWPYNELFGVDSATRSYVLLSLHLCSLYIGILYHVSKNCAQLFLSQLCQISTKCRNFCHKDGNDDKLMWGALTF